MPLQCHHKLRIKVPKSLMVTTRMHMHMHSKCHSHIKQNNAISSERDNLSTRVKHGNQCQRGLVVKYPSKSKGKKNEPICDLGDGKGSKGCPIVTTNKALSSELGKSLVFVDNEPSVVATLSQIVTLEEDFEPDKSKEDKKKKGGVGRMKQHLLSFLDEKKKGWNDFIKAKKRKNGFSSEVHGDGALTRFRQARRRRKASLWRMVRFPSRILVVRLKLKMIKSLMLKKKVTKQCEQGGDELCRKRILMEARCKPLSPSGTLRYDNNGLHLPEIVP